jgi:DHA1 family multidrug resistance protein-like MFS transporter
MDMMIYGLLIPVFPVYASRLGVSESVLGIIFGVYAAMLLLFSIPMGLFSDRVGRRPLIATGTFLLAFATALFGFSTTVTHLFIARTVQGISAAATWSAGLALLADTTDPSRLGEKMGISLSAVALGTVLGPVIGGLLFEYLGYAATFLVPAVVVAIVFSASPATIGFVFAALAVATAIAQPAAGRIYDRHGGSRYLIGGGLLLSGAAIFVAMQASTLPLIAAAILALGVTLSSALVPVMPIMASIYRGQDSQGVAYGMYNTFFSIGLSIGPFAGAALLSRYSLPAIFLLQAGVLGVIGMLGCFLLGRLGWR